MKAQELKAICKSNAELLDTTVGKINVAKAEQLQAWYDTLLVTPGAVLPNSTPADETAEEITAVVTDADADTKVLFDTNGKPYTVIGLPFTGLTENGNFKFAFKDSHVVSTNDGLLTLRNAGRLSEGTVMYFSVDSLSYSTRYSSYLGNVVASANADLMKIIEHRKENKLDNKSLIADMVNQGMSREEANKAVNTMIVEEARATRKKRTLEF
jgi:hypothetical protein